MSLLITLVAFLVAIGVLVTVHEYGHYWVAKRCGIKVLTFSIGFGKPLLRWQRGETQWQLAALPLGGFVKMLDEREAPVAEAELHRAFNRQSLPKRMAVVAAGPLANLLLAVLLYSAIFLAGVQIMQPRISTVIPGSAAERAGFVVGDTITQIGDAHIDSWADARLALVDAASARTPVEVAVLSRSGSARQLLLGFDGLDKNDIDGEVAERVGLSIAVVKPVVQSLLEGGGAAKAGLRQGDRIVAVAGAMAGDWPAILRGRPAQETPLLIERDGVRQQVTLTPQAQQRGNHQIGLIGIGVAYDDEAMHALAQTIHPGPMTAVAMAAKQTWSTASLSLRMMWRMLTGHVSVKQLSGPVAMAEYAGQSARISLTAYLEYLCLISISLGVLNLLPIPVLDGGHLMYYSAELLRGRPLSARAVELGQRVGVGLLVALMAVAMFNDLTRLVGG